MTILDFVELWWRSARVLLEGGGVIGHFERSPTDRPNPSCSLNLRRGELEVDLLVWSSGEADISVVSFDGSVSQEHFDNIVKYEVLEYVLSTLSSIAAHSLE